MHGLCDTQFVFLKQDAILLLLELLILIYSPFMNEIYNSTRGLAMMGSNLRQIKVYDVIEFACTIGHIS